MAEEKKTADELLQEAEDKQRELAPELYEDDPKKVEEPEDDPAKDVEDDPTPPVEDDDADDKKPKSDAVPEPEDETKVEGLQAEITRLTDELNQEKSARGRLKASSVEMQNLKDQIDALTGDLKQMQDTTIKKAEADQEDLQLKELIEEYGEDSQAVKMYKTFDEKIKKISSKFEKDFTEVDKKVTGVAETTVKSAEDRFYGDLADKVPDWETVVNDPKFGDFLQNRIPFTKQTLYDALNGAANTFDVSTVADIYIAYKDETKPADEPKPDDNTSPDKKKKKEDLLAPANTSKGEVTIPEQEIYSPEEVKKMTVDIANLTAQGKTKAADKLQKKLDSFLDNLGNLVP